MAEVKILIKGIHGKPVGDKVQIGATATLIKSDKNILVDTGYFGDEEALIEALAKENLSPEKIDIVILTHMHLDHVVNTYLFKDSKIYCKLRKNYIGQYHVPKEKSLYRFELKDGTELAKDVSILLTPGHTEDHMSVLVKTETGNVVVAGDAIASEDLVDTSKKPALAADFDDFDISRKKILAIADYIIPGHGDMFEAKK